ncbi:MAG: MFS transporter [Proteobacteria bacterium]|nr:MFS transporter [Pseudomonadota bacterium]
MTTAAAAELGSLRTKLFYGFGSVAYGLKNAGFHSLLGLYYNQIIGMPAGLVGLAIFLALTIDAFADPVIGHISDNLRTRWGRRHPFMYAAAVPVGVSFFFLWYPPALSTDQMFFYLFAMAVVVRTFISMFEIPNSAMIAELTTDYDNRTHFLSFRYFFSVLGAGVLGFVALRYILVPDATHPVGQLNPHGYVTYGLIAGAAMTTAILISSLGTHRCIKHFRVIEPRDVTLMDTLREVGTSLSNPSFLVLLGAALCGTVSIGVSGFLALYFATYLWGLTAAQIALFSFCGLAAAVTGVLTATPLSRRFGKRRLGITLFIAFILTSSLPILLRLIGFFPENGSPWLLPLLLLDRLVSDTLGITVLIMFSSMLTDVVEDNEIKTKRRSEGLYFAASAFVNKAISGLGAFIGGMMLSAVDFPIGVDPSKVDMQTVHDLAYVYMPFIVIMFTAGMLLMSRYGISRESHLDNLRKLEESAVLADAPVSVEEELTDGLPERAAGE